MHRQLLLLLLLSLFSLRAQFVGGNVTIGPYDPVMPGCIGQMHYNTATGTFWGCKNSVWTPAGMFVMPPKTFLANVGSTKGTYTSGLPVAVPLAGTPLTGAVGDGAADDSDAFQNAVNAICQQTNGGKLMVAAGRYRWAKPVYATCNGLAIDGESKSSTFIAPTFFGEAFVHHSPNYAGMVLGPPLLNGTGQALRLNPYDGTGVNMSWLNLGDAYPMRQLNGLSQFTIEFTCKLNAAPTAASTFNAITSSFGRADATSSGSFAYRLFIKNDQSLSFWWTIGGAPAAITTAANAIPLRANTHVAVTYSANTITIWVNGHSVLTQGGITGNWNQGEFENVCFGCEVTEWPEGSINTGLLPPDMWVDGVRFSNINRYPSGTFAPPAAKFVNDGNTLLLLNFDKVMDNGVIIGGYNGTVGLPVWLTVRGQGDTNPITSQFVGYSERLELSHINWALLGASGPFLARSILWKQTDSQWTMGGGFGSNGPLMFDYAYQGSFERNYIVGDTTSSYCMSLGIGSGSTEGIRDTTIWNCKAQFSMNETTANISGLYLTGTPGVRYQLINKQLNTATIMPFVCTACVIAGEGNDSGLIATTYFTGVGTFVGGRIEGSSSPGNTTPPVIVDGMQSVIGFRGTQFWLNGFASPSEYVHIATAPTRKVLLDNTTNNNAGIPWSTTAGSVSVVN